MPRSLTPVRRELFASADTGPWVTGRHLRLFFFDIVLGAIMAVIEATWNVGGPGMRITIAAPMVGGKKPPTLLEFDAIVDTGCETSQAPATLIKSLTLAKAA